MKQQMQIGWFLRAIATCLLFATQTGCEAAAPPATPISVRPTVEADRVPDSFDFFFGTDPAPFAAAANERLKPETLGAYATADLSIRLDVGTRMLVRHKNQTGSKVFLCEKIWHGFVGVVLPRSQEGYLIVPVEWLRRTVVIGVADETAAHDWYVAMSRRIATVGKASGIAVFPNGNAMGIEIDLLTVDAELVVRLKSLRAGEYQPAEWGPRIDGEAVSTAKMNDHDGISMEDLLREQLAPTPRPKIQARPAPNPTPTAAMSPP